MRTAPWVHHFFTRWNGENEETMGKIDALLKQLFKDNTRCADILNFAVHGGEQVIKPEELCELDTAHVVSPYSGDVIVPKQKQRDILKAQVKPCVVGVTDKETAYLIYGIENQSEIHYAMPVKTFLYDGMLYADQVKAIEKAHQKDKKSQKGMTSGEYLSGFRKTDHILPVITLVVYFGPGKWDGPRSLHEMFLIKNRKILAFVTNHRINLVAPGEMSEKKLRGFHSGLREMFGFIKHSEDETKLKAMVKNNPRFKSMDRDEVEVIKATTHAKNIVIKPDKEGKVDMCKALVDMEMNAKAEGEAKGMAKGEAKGIAKGMAEGLAKGLVLSITNLMESMKLPMEKAMDILKVPAKDRKVYAGLVAGNLKKHAK